MKNQTSERINLLIKKIENYWLSLREQFDTNVDIKFCSALEYSSNLISFESYSEKNIYNILSDHERIYYKSSNILCNYKYNDENIIIEVHSINIISNENFYRLLILFNMDFDKMYKYYHVILKHKIGLIKHSEIMLGWHINELTNYDKRLAKEYTQFIESMNITDTPDQNIEKYMNLYEEKIANDIVGLTWKDFQICYIDGIGHCL